MSTAPGRADRVIRVVTAANAYRVALDETLAHEGGWYDGTQPHDPNPTMRGVTQRTYDAFRRRRGVPWRSVREIADVELEAIYRGYWDGAALDTVATAGAPLTAITLFDHAVNAGPGRAVRLLQGAIGASIDGMVGPETRAQLAAVLAHAGPQADRELAQAVSWARVDHYVDLAAPAGSKHRASLPSWMRRVQRFAQRFLTPLPHSPAPR